MEELKTTTKANMKRDMVELKNQFSQFFGSFLQNYTQEMSRTSLLPLINDIKEIKHIQNDFSTQRMSIQSV